MRRISTTLALTLALVSLFGPPTAIAAPTFHTTEAGFTAASNTLLIDFESLSTTFNSSYLVNGNRFSNPDDTASDAMVACGAIPCTGQPFDSTIMTANRGANPGGILRIDMAPGVTAAGGLFGALRGTGTGTLSLFGASGLLDTQTISFGDMGVGLPKTFFGWTSSSQVLTAIEFSGTTLTSGFSTPIESVDNFRYGAATTTSIPLPSSLTLFFASMLLLLGAVTRRPKAS